MVSVVILKSRISHQGGLERYATLIAKTFALKGAKTTLLTTGKPIEIPHVEVVSLGKHPLSNYLALHFFEREAAKWLRAHPNDIVFGLDRNSAQTHYRAGNGSHQTFLKTKASTFWSKLWYQWSPKQRFILKTEKKLFTNPSLKKLFTNSKMVQKELIKQFNIDPAKITVVHNGVDLRTYTFQQSSKEENLRQLKLPKASAHLLFIGHNYERKGLKEALKALALKKDWDFQFMIVGADKNVKKYQDLAYKLSLEKRVHFFGEQKDLVPFYAAADIFILPSYYDPFANVTIEALAMGLFVVTSQSNGGHEVLTSQTGVILKNNEDLQEFSIALEKAKAASFSFEARLQRRESVLNLDINSQLTSIVETTLQSIEQ